MPLTHRYWFWFAGTWRENEKVITSREGIEIDKKIAEKILINLIVKLDRVKTMSDEEFEKASCDEALCMLFHNPDYPALSTEGIKKKLVFLSEDNYGGVINDVLISNQIYPLVLSRDVIYGNIKQERRYINENKNEIETVFEVIK